jgi:hypothetical protein
MGPQQLYSFVSAPDGSIGQKAVGITTVARLFPQLQAKVKGCTGCFFGSERGTHHLHHLHDGYRIEEVHATHLIRPLGGAGEVVQLPWTLPK